MLSLTLSVVALFALNVLSPGASFVLTLRHALAHGRRTGCAFALGLSMADISFACLALFGVAALLRANTGMVAAIGWVGGVWLAVLGLRLYRQSQAVNLAVDRMDVLGELPRTVALRLGASAGLVNPQAIVFFSSVFVAGLNAGPPVPGAAVLVGAIAATSISLRWGIAWMVSMPTLRQAYLARRKHVESLSAVALFAFGMKLAVKAMFPWALKAVTFAGVAVHILR